MLCRLSRQCEQSLMLVPAFMGAPAVLTEKITCGSELINTIDTAAKLYEIGGYEAGRLSNTGK